MKKNLIILLSLAVLAAVVFYLYTNRSNKSYNDSFADFSVKDTASITKIVIADTQGKKIELKRESGYWSLNDTLEARQELINLALGAFRDVVIQSPIAENAKDHHIRSLAARHKLVQIFQNNNSEPTKIWYVGDATPSHFGTVLLLELPDKGKAPSPYIVEVPWHKGFITPFFMADMLDWMQTPIFRYPSAEFSSISVHLFGKPEGSFALEKSGDFYKVKSAQTGQYLNGLDSLFVKDYIKGFESVYFESFDNLLTPDQQDSILKSTPLYRVSVMEKSGKKNEISIYRKKEGVREIDLEPVKLEYDRDRYYGYYKNRFVYVQRYAFDKLIVELDQFRP